MNTLQSQINPRSQAFADNAEHMQSLVNDLESLVEHIKWEVVVNAIRRATKRGENCCHGSCGSAD